MFLTDLFAGAIFGDYYLTDGLKYQGLDSHQVSYADPNGYDYELITLLPVVAAFAIIGALLALISILGGGFTMEDKPSLIKILGVATAVLTLVCLITEGVYYNYDFLKYSSPSTYRNVSGAQKYLTNSLKKLYERGKELLEKDPNYKEYDCNADDWDTASKRIGDKDPDRSEGEKIITYSDFFGNYFPVLSPYNSTIYFTPYILPNNAKLLNATLLCKKGTLSVGVASLAFNLTKPKVVGTKRYFCWNETASRKLQCESLTNESLKNSFSGIGDFSDISNVNQYILKAYGKNIKYYGIKEIAEDGIDIDYDATLPSAFHLLTDKELTAETEKIYSENIEDVAQAFYFEKATSSFRINPNSLLKWENKQIVKETSLKGYKEGDKFYFCPSKPANFSDPSCLQTSSLSYGSHFENLYPEFYDNTNVGVYNKKVVNYNKWRVSKAILDHMQFCPKHVIILLALQIVAIIFWAIGTVMSPSEGKKDGNMHAAIL